MITYSVPVRRDGVFVGVVTMDVQLDSTSEVAHSTGTGGSSSSTDGGSAAWIGGGDSLDEQASNENEAASEAAQNALDGAARLDKMAKGPQGVAAALAQLEDEELDDDAIKKLLREMLLADGTLFGVRLDAS